KISINVKEILFATKKSSIMLSEDKIVIKIGNYLIILDDSNISLESATINIKCSANINIQASQYIDIKSINNSINADV
ncbi:hypothetical protein NAI41_11595, partial [Francisella tularensis subsp. holarctica]|nr:hypothetical protein [Francisella tularensis subsp. holarctica]